MVSSFISSPGQGAQGEGCFFFTNNMNGAIVETIESPLIVRKESTADADHR
jgi:hypothetical protein